MSANRQFPDGNVPRKWRLHEPAKTYATLVGNGLTKAEVARRLGRSWQNVYHALKSACPPEIAGYRNPEMVARIRPGRSSRGKERANG